MKSKGSNGGVFRTRPSVRVRASLNVMDWIRGKQADDGAEGLWRIHDSLYDLGEFAKIHPGGRFWLETTKGTDITEAFESHHITGKAEKLLSKYRVRKAGKPRMSLVTFREDGFYRTMKRKIRQSNLVIPRGSTWQTRTLCDFFLLGFFASLLLGVWRGDKWSVLAGLLLQMCSVSAHNFFHMRDNFRMYYFNFSLLSHRTWRISHALSHHQYPNTYLDLEVSLFEPIFQLLPTADKTFSRWAVTCAMSPLVFATGTYIQVLARIRDLISTGGKSFHWDEFIGFSVPALLWAITGQSLRNVFYSWSVAIVTSSFMFYLVGLIAAHHHPDIYHEGDYLGSDKDFGILQLAAVRDREEISGNIFLTLTTFGDHVLHHLFPTVDHRNLHLIRPIFDETCKEFNVYMKPENTGSLFLGLYKQLARNYTNGKLLIKQIKNH